MVARLGGRHQRIVVSASGKEWALIRNEATGVPYGMHFWEKFRLRPMHDIQFSDANDACGLVVLDARLADILLETGETYCGCPHSLLVFRNLLPTAPILMTLAAGYPHRPLQFSLWGWLPVPEGMVSEERFFSCRIIVSRHVDLVYVVPLTVNLWCAEQVPQLA